MFYTIGEFSKRIGISPYSLRLWEKNGKLIPHHRTAGGQRIYTEQQALEYLGLSEKKEVIFTFSNEKIISSPLSDVSDSELSQIIHSIEAVQRERQKV